MESEYARLQSFRDSTEKSLGARLAEAGLYLVDRRRTDDSTAPNEGEKKTTRIACAFCGVEFDGVGRALAERPLREHIRRSPLCPFARGRARDDVPLRDHDIHPRVNDDPNFEFVRLRSFARCCSSSSSYSTSAGGLFCWDSGERQRLAESGLYRDRRSDAVLCAFCDFRLSPDEASGLGREKSTPGNVLESHASGCSGRRGRRCPLLAALERGGGGGAVGNVPLRETDAASLGVPSHPRMEDLRKRLATFDGEWPSRDRPSKDDLAECGFYYAGVADCTTCHWCDATLGNWEPHDVPRVEHSFHSPRCPVARRTLEERNAAASIRTEAKSVKARGKGGEEEEEEEEEEKVPRETKSCPSNEETSERRNGTFRDRDSAPSAPSGDGGSSITCVVCLAETRNVVYEPCRHLVSCEKCSLLISTCPVCRKPISDTMKVYV